MRRTFLIAALAAAFGASAEDMRPNKEPVPSPSDVRAQRRHIGDTKDSERVPLSDGPCGDR